MVTEDLGLNLWNKSPLDQPRKIQSEARCRPMISSFNLKVHSISLVKKVTPLKHTTGTATNDNSKFQSVCYLKLRENSGKWSLQVQTLQLHVLFCLIVSPKPKRYTHIVI